VLKGRRRRTRAPALGAHSTSITRRAREKAAAAWSAAAAPSGTPTVAVPWNIAVHHSPAADWALTSIVLLL
jgi:hypothetical protein